MWLKISAFVTLKATACGAEGEQGGTFSNLSFRANGKNGLVLGSKFATASHAPRNNTIEITFSGGIRGF